MKIVRGKVKAFAEHSFEDNINTALIEEEVNFVFTKFLLIYCIYLQIYVKAISRTKEIFINLRSFENIS